MDAEAGLVDRKLCAVLGNVTLAVDKHEAGFSVAPTQIDLEPHSDTLMELKWIPRGFIQ